MKAQELASIGQWWETLNSWWTCSSWSVPETSSWLDSRRNSEFENLKMELVFFRRCHRWAAQCVWYGRIHVYRREWSHSCWCCKLPFAFFFSVALPDRLHRNRQAIVRFCGLWLWQYLSVQRLLSSTCWLLSFLHCDLWTFCDFLQVPATIVFIMLLIVPFSPIGWVLNQRLSFNPRFLLILR